MQDSVITGILLHDNHFKHRSLWQNAARDGAFGRGWFDADHNVSGEEAGFVSEAVEGFHGVDDTALAIILKQFDLAAFAHDLKFVEALAEIDGVLQRHRSERLADEFAEDLDIMAVGAPGVLAFFGPYPEIDQFILGSILRDDGVFALHCELS